MRANRMYDMGPATPSFLAGTALISCEEYQSMPAKTCLPRIASVFAMVVALAVFVGSAFAAEWKEKVLYSFQGLPDGATPASGVVFDKTGNLYGATTDGGANNCPGITQCGTVFQLTPPAQKGKAWTENVLYVFKGVTSNDGETPGGGVLFDPAGNLYGTTAYGGNGGCELFGNRVGCGTVYEMVPPKQKGGAWTESVIYSFQGGKDGYLPQGDLTFDKRGNLYGATEYGGGYGSCNAPYYQYCSTVFKLSPPKTKGGKWKEQVLYSFKSDMDGANPNGGLVLDRTMAIYGTTYFGGDENGSCKGGAGGAGCGTVFKLTIPAKKGGQWEEMLIHVFRDGSDGTHPSAGMIFDRKGSLYGTTFSGGTVFRMTPPTGKSGSWTKTVPHNFNSSGYDPQGSLILDTSGNLYGTTTYAQTAAGTVFRLAPSSRKTGAWKFTLLYGFGNNPDGGQPAAGLVFDNAGKLYGTTTEGGTGTGCSFHGCGTVFQLEP
jgi:hypothetical protein